MATMSSEDAELSPTSATFRSEKPDLSGKTRFVGYFHAGRRSCWHEWHVLPKASYYLHFSEGTIVRIGWIDVIQSWHGVLKRKLGPPDAISSYCGYQILFRGPGLEFSVSSPISFGAFPDQPQLVSGYSGEWLRLGFGGPLEWIARGDSPLESSHMWWRHDFQRQPSS